MRYAYVDSGVWIIRAEGFPAYRKVVNERIRSLMMAGWQVCISSAVRLEVLAKPRQENRKDLLATYQGLFDRVHILPTYNEIFDQALAVAETDRLMGLDAIHAAFAVRYGCELFVTTDPDFRRLKTLPLHLIDLRQTTLP